MFNSRAVREAVTAKLATLRVVDEAIIHDLYARAIFDELKNAHQATRNVQQALLKCVKARGVESKWVMVDKNEWDAVGKAVDALAGNFKL